jgi:hypothetical protein
MKPIHPNILAFLKHYAQKLGNPLALRIADGGGLRDEAEARAFVRFLVEMHDASRADDLAGATVLGQKARVSDAEKVRMLFEDFVEESGFEKAVDDFGD